MLNMRRWPAIPRRSVPVRMHVGSLCVWKHNLHALPITVRHVQWDARYVHWVFLRPLAGPFGTHMRLNLSSWHVQQWVRLSGV